MEIAQDRSGDAMYRTGFLCIDLPFPVKKNIEDYTLQELGTFVHEYVHFLQNITTPWGLYESARLYERISHLYANLPKVESGIIYAPVEEDYILSHQTIIRRIHLGRGSDIDGSGNSVYNIKISDQPNFIVNNEVEFVEGVEIPKVTVYFDTINGQRQSILFGAWTIKESMAAMIQEKVDPMSPDRHAEVPYNFVRRLAQAVYPNIAEDSDKLISICYASLFSLSPAICFLDLAEKANSTPSLHIDKILHDFFSQGVMKNGQTKTMSICDFYEDLSNRFLNTVDLLLAPVKTEYLKVIIKVTQFKDCKFPLLWFIEDKINAEDVRKFLDSAGYPAIIGTKDSGMFPYLDEDKETQLLNILLLGHETLFKYLTSNPPTCPRAGQCKETGNYNESSCTTTPWRRDDDCVMTESAKLLEIQDLNIIKS